MSDFFPKSRVVKMVEGIESQSFDLNDDKGTQIILSKINPGAVLQPHQHNELQIGMALSGRFLMEVDGEEEILEPLKNAYIARPNILHGAKNIFSESALGLDIKYKKIKKGSRVNCESNAIFLKLVNDIQLKTGIRMQFFVSPWCEIMLSHIPSGASMPLHAHSNEQLGIAVQGKYLMQVGTEQQVFEYGKVYFSPPNVPHGACNPYDEVAVSLNVFIPPRYNLISKKEMLSEAA